MMCSRWFHNVMQCHASLLHHYSYGSVFELNNIYNNLQLNFSVLLFLIGVLVFKFKIKLLI